MKKSDIKRDPASGRWQAHNLEPSKYQASQHLPKKKAAASASRAPLKAQGMSESERKSYHLKSKRH